MVSVLRFGNCEAFDRRAIPVLSNDDFRDFLTESILLGARILAFFGSDPTDKGITATAVLAHADTGKFSIFSTRLGNKYHAFTPDCPQASWFEREMAEQWGVVPQGHPWLKPIRFHKSYRDKQDAWGRDTQSPILPCVTDYFRVEGEQVHEVAVGPVHAGVIEPGHFRFQCYGEEVYHLEISLGYQHRGIERAMLTASPAMRVQLAEKIAGDTSIGHTTAHCLALEALCGRTVPARAEVIRGIALELERLANHVGDMGALAGDVGYLPTMSYCGRLRGDLLNLTAQICGNRFGRNLVRPGGVAFDIEGDRAKRISDKFEEVISHVKNALELLWGTPSVLSRFEETGALTKQVAEQIGLVGVAARACGIERDARFEFPSGVYTTSQLPVATWRTGDVFARAWVRWLEIQYSHEFIREELGVLPAGSIAEPITELKPNFGAVSLVEGWRGEVCHVVFTNSNGEVELVKVVDPSFHNWQGLAVALRNQQISDFPLCNKSFNLSYCGHDL